MRKSSSFLIALAALALIAVYPAVASDLSLKTTVTPSPSSPASYSPGSGTTFTVPISVKNTSSSSADFIFIVDKDMGNRNASLTVNNIECLMPLSIMDSGGEELPSWSDAQSNLVDIAAISHTVKKNYSATVKVYVKAKPEYYGPDGNYASTVTFSCYKLPLSASSVPQFSVSVPLIYSVPSRATLTLSNGTLDFGELTEGESLETTISVDATRPWDLYLQSQKGGCLQHATDIYSKVWYTLTVEGEDFGNLTNPTICYSKSTYSWWPWTGYDETLAMEVTIGEVPFGIEPGIYNDNIWLTIITR